MSLKKTILETRPNERLCTVPAAAPAQRCRSGEAAAQSPRPAKPKLFPTWPQTQPSAGTVRSSCGFSVLWARSPEASGILTFASALAASAPQGPRLSPASWAQGSSCVSALSTPRHPETTSWRLTNALTRALLSGRGSVSPTVVSSLLRSVCGR